MKRYVRGPVRYYSTPSVTVVWYGARVFYASRHFQSGWKEGDETSTPPIPTYEEWQETIGEPVSYAYNEATKLRFALYVRPKTLRFPYRFAIKAELAEWVPGDTVVYNVLDFDTWKVEHGVAPEDAASYPQGPWWYKLIVRYLLNPIMSRVSFIGFNPDEFREWREWGGEWPRQP